MKASHIPGLPAINVLNGTKVGDVERAYLDPVERRIVGFAIATSGGFLQPERGVLADTIEVQALGEAALTLLNSAPQGAETTRRYDELVDLAALQGREIFSVSGILLGHLADADLDERLLTLSAIDVSPHASHHPREIPVAQIVTWGPEVMVVQTAEPTTT